MPGAVHGACRRPTVVVARFGAVSTTGDPDGEITETGVSPTDRSSCPPARCASARPPTRRSRCGGVRAYKRARRGEEVEMPERRSRCTASNSGGARVSRAEFEIECSSGTYVRSLVADLGDAYCESLRRTAIGPFDVDEAEMLLRSTMPCARRGPAA